MRALGVDLGEKRIGIAVSDSKTPSSANDTGQAGQICWDTNQDERLTTATAAKELAIQGLDSKKQRKVIDQVAASVILQSWLDNRT